MSSDLQTSQHLAGVANDPVVDGDSTHTAALPTTTVSGEANQETDDSPGCSYECNFYAPSIELRSFGGAFREGQGLFAITRIEKGTRLVNEAPLIALPAPGDQFQAICEAYENLSDDQQNVFWKLPPSYPVHLQKMSTFLDALCKIAVDLISKGDQASPREKAVLDEISEPIEQLCACWRVAARYHGNRYSLTTTSIEERGEIPAHINVTGLFTVAAHFNHSCIPNCYAAYNSETGCMTVHATESIDADEELTVSVLGGEVWYHTALHRAELLMKMTPPKTCICAACDSGSPNFHKQDKLRAQLHITSTFLNNFLLRCDAAQHPLCYPKSAPVHLSEEGLEEGQESILKTISMLREVGCKDLELVRWHLALVNLIHPHIEGTSQASLAHAKLAHSILTRCWGDDHPDLIVIEDKVAEVERRVWYERNNK